MSDIKGQQRRLREHETSGLTSERLRLELRRSLPSLSLVLGLVALALIVGAVILSNLGTSTPFEDSYEIRVAVDDAKGVQPGAQEVRLAGVRVGRITGVSLDSGTAVIDLSIKGQYAPLYRDATLRLRPQTALQDMYLNIEDRGEPGSGELTEGQTLGAERTRSPVDISRVLNVFDAPTRERFEQMTDHFGRALGDNGTQLRRTFVEIVPFLRAAQRLTRETAIRSEATKRLVHNMRLVSDELARRDERLTALITAGSETFGELRAASDPLDRLLAELPATISQLRVTSDTLSTGLSELRPALDELQPTADVLDPALDSLTSLGQEAQPAFKSLRAVNRRLLPLTVQASPLADTLADAFAALRPAAPRLDRITAAIVPCEPALQKFFQWTPSVVKFGDANGPYPRSEAVSFAPGQHIAGVSCAEGGP